MSDSQLSVASESDSVQLTADGVLRIAVATEKAGNSLDRDCFNRGTEALLKVARGEIKAGAVLLLGTGANFCAGGNVRSFAAAPDRPVFLSGLAGDFHEFVKALVGANLPVVGAIQGWAAGAGMSLVTHCDVAIGGNATKLRPAYVGIGLTPDGGLTWSLPRVVGTARARDIILTNRILGAAEALEIGLLSRVVDDEQVLATAEAAAADLVTGPWRTLAATRALLSDSPAATLAEQLDAEARSISALSGVPEGIEGVDAFLAKRSPDYSSLNGK
ncbi:2-(1,2-epoxy-1,2-dihydrophenyl)acetyl-CoA isomerase [Williamsia limnetica]|uniref:2-(1,2-epoxy-1,2-dihydrophenyl)acetyl-CoA isomerase n=1 Tax=Williamsia limnetica TaxID=882452 RepID=A0A318RT21_WILLI|nr:enoyl-CoA hydratase-related protein [Williamsia limnetica]PYE15540.1 2-(1,2-epoxy-1,2-dihydrophenyl)acetyl-CoA isomerase [Williamsia limnetica]